MQDKKSSTVDDCCLVVVRHFACVGRPKFQRSHWRHGREGEERRRRHASEPCVSAIELRNNGSIRRRPRPISVRDPITPIQYVDCDAISKWAAGPEIRCNRAARVRSASRHRFLLHIQLTRRPRALAMRQRRRKTFLLTVIASLSLMRRRKLIVAVSLRRIAVSPLAIPSVECRCEYSHCGPA